LTKICIVPCCVAIIDFALLKKEDHCEGERGVETVENNPRIFAPYGLLKNSNISLM
jgi:hypothetical protein